MIDFILGALLGSGLMFAYFHFKGTDPSKAVSDLTIIEIRIKTMISDALNELKTAADAAKDKAVADALAAAGDAVPAAVAQQEATDEQAVRDFTAANFPPPVEG